MPENKKEREEFFKFLGIKENIEPILIENYIQVK